MASAQAACGPPRAGAVTALLDGTRAGTLPGTGSLRWLLPDGVVSEGVLVLVAVAVWLAPVAELAGFAAANAAFRAAAEAADKGALATTTGAEATTAAADAATAGAGAATFTGVAAAADAAADGLGDAGMIVSDPGPVSGTGKGRTATASPVFLEPVKEPDPPSHTPKPISPTHTAPANSQRFGLDGVTTPGVFAFLGGSEDCAGSDCTAGTEFPMPENSGSSPVESSTRSRPCATLGCGMRMVRSGSKEVSSVGVKSAVLVPGL